MRNRRLVLALIAICVIALTLGVTATAAAEPESTEEAEWVVRTIPTPASGVVPSFASSAGDYIAWSGAGGGSTRMYVYDMVAGSNKTIPVTLPGSYYNPSVDGRYIAYQGARTGSYDDIYVYDIQTAIVQRVTRNTDPGDWNDWNPRMDTGRIVWEKDMKGITDPKPGIYLYDVAMATSTLVLAGSQYRSPDLSGDYLVCVENAPVGDGDGSRIILYNLVTQELTIIAENTQSNDHPRIDGDRVVWTSGDLWVPGAAPTWPTYQIKLYDITAGTTTTLTNNIAGNVSPSIAGTCIAWETKQPSAVMTYDCETETVTQISQQGDEVAAPEVDGTGISWHGNKGLYYAVPASEATRFPDVPAGHPYATAIEGMAEAGIIEGYTNGNFGPNDKVTRRQFAKMIVLTMGFTVNSSDVFDFTDSKLADQPSGELYPYHYIAKAALTGLTTGYTDGSFRPLNNITCQQVVTMIVRAGSTVLAPPPSSWSGVLSYADKVHGQNIRLAEYNGLLIGIVGPKGTLASWSTTGYATRGEVAQMLWNLLGKLGSTE